MIPIVILSLSVLIYGLVLSLEQRRKEIAIHRVIGATSNGLQSMVLLELAVMSTFAWIAGYIIAISVFFLVVSIGRAGINWAKIRPIIANSNTEIAIGYIP